ncbi:MAG: hypothetical protein CM1200mP29_03430 [Verrucomicrobiota bacterium]|nr:MAG: hypothetical protein CM1200mP29_03430 [Verrucomicrobiota bacterium]
MNWSFCRGSGVRSEQKVADQLNNERLDLAKWVRRLTGWRMRVVPLPLWQKKIQPLLRKNWRQTKRRWSGSAGRTTGFRSATPRPQAVPAHVDLSGVALWRPQERQVVNPTFSGCGLYSECRELKPATGVALLWKRLKLVEENGSPTRRGRVSFFFRRATAWALRRRWRMSRSDRRLVYELANLDAGYRFGNEENRWEGAFPSPAVSVTAM